MDIFLGFRQDCLTTFGALEDISRVLQQAHLHSCCDQTVLRYLSLLLLLPKRTPFITTYTKFVLLPSTPAKAMLL